MSIIEQALSRLEANKAQGARMGEYLPMPAPMPAPTRARARTGRVVWVAGSAVVLAMALLGWSAMPPGLRTLALDTLGLADGALLTSTRSMLTSHWPNGVFRSFAETGQRAPGGSVKPASLPVTVPASLPANPSASASVPEQADASPAAPADAPPAAAPAQAPASPTSLLPASAAAAEPFSAAPARVIRASSTALSASGPVQHQPAAVVLAAPAPPVTAVTASAGKATQAAATPVAVATPFSKAANTAVTAPAARTIARSAPVTVAVTSPPVAASFAPAVKPLSSPGSSGWHGPAWVSQGDAILRQGDLSTALQGWAAGLGRLPADYPVVPLPPSISRSAAVTSYRSLADKYPAVLVVDNSSGTPVWQVMLVPDKSELTSLLAEVRNTLGRKSLGTVAAGDWRTLTDGNKGDNRDNRPGHAGGTVTATATGASVVGAKNNQLAQPVVPVNLPAGQGGLARPAFINVAANAANTSPASADSEPDPGRTVQASASSSADAILRRFATVERLIAQGKFEAALEGATQVEAEVGETWQTRYFKGTAAKGLRRWDEAVQALTRANQLNPSSTKVLLDRAICQQELGNHEAALEDLRRARTLSPNLPELTLNAGYSFDALERREDAMREYKKFLDMTASRDEYAKVRAWVSRRITR